MILIQYLIPEVFLSLSIFSLLMIGVFIKNSFNLIYKLSIFLIFLLILIVLNTDGETINIVDIALTVDSKSTARIPEAHRTIYHVICELVEKNLTM